MVQIPNIHSAQTQLPSEKLPTMYDLPSESPQDSGLPDEFHDLQPQLLSRTLKLTHYTQDRCFKASDLNLYYDPQHPLWYKRPDWFLVVVVPRLYEGKDMHLSYKEDLGRFYEASAKLPDESAMGSEAPTSEAQSPVRPPDKFEMYEQILKVPHYLVYSRYSRQLCYFK